MARRPRVAPEFTPEEWEQVEAGREAILRNSAPPPPRPVPIAPQPGGLGMRGGKAGGFWYNKGGKVEKHGSDTCVVCKDKFSK